MGHKQLSGVYFTGVHSRPYGELETTELPYPLVIFYRNQLSIAIVAELEPNGACGDRRTR